MLRQRPLRVAALVDLKLSPLAGGHVKCWQRLAGAAGAFADVLDLTVFFSGSEDREEEIGENVRYVLRRPVFSTSRLGFLAHIPDHTDLARRHPAVERALKDFDVLHTTDAYFAFARTAERVSARERLPLVNSIHTDTPGYGRVFTEDIIERLCGDGALKRLFVDRLAIHERVARRLERRLARHQSLCRFALVSRPEDRPGAEAALSPERVAMLRRGIDMRLFSPSLRDRRWLEATYGIRADRVLVFFAGRINRGKNVLTLAHAVRALLDRGAPIHLVCAGAGEERPAVEALLGPAVTCPGAVEEALAARLFANADVFAQPSEIEILANVITEALASGTAVAAAARGVAGKLPGAPLVEVPSGVAAWVAALESLIADPARLRARGRAARSWAECSLPSWEDVLGQDLLPLWLRAAAEGRRDE